MTENEQNGVSRRTVTKAMAWAVPAVAVASTVPIAAASCIPQIGITDDSCKKANASSYYLRFDLTGDPNCVAPVDCSGVVYALRYNGNQQIFWGSESNPNPVALGAEIIVCNINPANYIHAYVSVDCINDGAPFWTTYDIGMPQVSNGKCLDPEFCAE